MRRGSANVGGGSIKRRVSREPPSKIVSARHNHDILSTGRRSQDARSGSHAIAVRQRCTASSEENHEMPALTGTKAITMGLDREEPAPEFFGQRKKQENLQFRLQVDRQTKASYATREAAEKAGLAIKKAYPILQVVVYDAAEGVHRTIEFAEHMD